MATSYSPRLGIGTPATNDPGWDMAMDTNLALLDGVNAVGALAVDFAEHPSATLNVRVAAGQFRKADGSVMSYAGASAVVVTASATSKIWLTNAGVLAVGSAFPTSGPYLPLASVVAGGSTITSIADARVPAVILAGATNCGTATLVGGTKAVAAPQITTSSLVFFSRVSAGGTVGTLTYTLTAGTGFTVTSSSGTDTSLLAYLIIEP